MTRPRRSSLSSPRSDHCVNADCAFTYVQDHISKPTSIVFVTARHQRFEVLLQMGSVMRDRVAFFVGIDVGVVALDLFGYSVIARSIEVCSDESNTCSGQTVTLREDRGFGCGLGLF